MIGLVKYVISITILLVPRMESMFSFTLTQKAMARFVVVHLCLVMLADFFETIC